MKIIKSILVALLLLPALLFAEETININTADKETLMMIKGVGEARAADIIDYREANGPFKTIEELTNIKGIGDTTLEKNSGNLTVEDKKN